MADEHNELNASPENPSRTEDSTCPPGAIPDPPGQKPSLEETLASLNQNMASMVDMLGKLYKRFDDNDLPQRPLDQGEKRHKRKSFSDPMSDSETDDSGVPPRKSKRQDDDALSLHASNSDDDLNDLIHRSCPPGPSKDDTVDNEDALLKELEAALHEDDKKGPKIQPQLADIARKRWGKKLSNEKVNGILAKHPQPKNCEELAIPRANPEIWAPLNAFKRKADLCLAKMQQSLQKATFAMLATCDKLLAVKSQVETKEMLTASVDTIALVGHVTSELSALRREQLKPSLRQEFHMICTNNASTTSNLLFGEDLPKQIRDAKETNRIGKMVTGPSNKQYDHNRGFRRNSSWLNRAPEKHHKGAQKQPFLGKGHCSAGKKKPYHERNDTDKK